MYSNDPLVNDIVLSVINDGNGDQCGTDYAKRVDLGRQIVNLYQFRAMAREYGRYAKKRFGSPIPTRAQWVEAGNLLSEYYEEHVKELS